MQKHKKYDLLERIIQSINEDGWNLFYLSDPQFHPFRLKIYKDSESLNIGIYIWHITHGGGAKRPAHEYRIQITGVERFEQESGGKTLILGWWEEGNVFAGFDYNMHVGKLGFSPSIQIREEALRKAYINGFAPSIKENNEIAIAFKPDFLVEYIKNLEPLHTFGEVVTDFEILERASEKPEEINEAVMKPLNEPRKVTITNVTKKIRDNSFKSRVLTAYGNKCALCGIQLKLIDAAHILPVNYEKSTDETSNGIALCALHHRAYDNALVTINREYRILLDEKKLKRLKDLNLDGGLKKFAHELRPLIHLPPAVNDRPHIQYVEKANEIRGWGLDF